MKKDISPEQFQKMFEITPEKVSEVIKRLVALYNPLYIYVFGSYARGKHDIDSDLDVMVVIDEFHDDRWNVLSAGYNELYGIKVPVDLLVYDQAKFEECKDEATSFCHTILKTGKLFYERK